MVSAKRQCLSLVARAWVAASGPRRKDEQQARVTFGAHLVGLMRVEDRERAGTRGDDFSGPVDFYLPVDDDKVCPFVDLMLLKRLA